MTCIKNIQELHSFLDDELDFPKRREFESHLKTCESCQTELVGLSTISKTIKQTLPTAAPIFLDEKVMSAYQNHHAEKQTVRAEKKVGWFGIPKLAFTTAFMLLAVFSTFAFLLGRMSVIEISDSIRAKENQTFESENKKNPVENASNSMNETQPVTTKIVEVPLIKEKIIKIPIIRERTVTRTIYVNRKQGNQCNSSENASTKDTFALNNSVKNGQVLTQTNLEGFEPVRKIEPRVTKKEEYK